MIHSFPSPARPSCRLVLAMSCLSESAGLGCSALLPLTISFAQEQLVVMGASVAGGVIAFYQLGYGIAAFGTGPLVDAGVGLPTLFGVAAIAAVIMGGLSFTLARKSPVAVVVPSPRPEEQQA